MQAKASEYERDATETRREVGTLQNTVKSLEEELQKAKEEVWCFPMLAHSAGFSFLLVGTCLMMVTSVGGDLTNVGECLPCLTNLDMAIVFFHCRLCKLKSCTNSCEKRHKACWVTAARPLPLKCGACSMRITCWTEESSKWNLTCR